MDLQQKTYMSVEKGSKMVQVVVDQDMPLGLLFDALMEMKGYVVERMVSAQQQEQAEADANMPPAEPEAEEAQEEEDNG